MFEHRNGLQTRRQPLITQGRSGSTASSPPRPNPPNPGHLREWDRDLICEPGLTLWTGRRSRAVNKAETGSRSGSVGKPALHCSTPTQTSRHTAMQATPSRSDRAGGCRRRGANQSYRLIAPDLTRCR